MVSTLFDSMPDEWKLVRIRDIFNPYKGTTPSTKVPEYWNGNIPFVTPTDITALKHANQVFLERTSKYLTEKGLKSKRLKLVPRNSLLVTTRATIGECAINKIEVTINQGIVALIPKDHNKIDILFYYYLIQIMKPYLESLASGSTYKEISLKRLSEIQIPIPPLDEQRKIARILYTVDMAIAKTDAIISRVEELRRALLDYLMTHGIGHKEYKETEIGKIPKEWKIVKLKEVASMFQYGLSVKLKNEGKYPIIKMDSIEDGVVIRKNIKYVDIDYQKFLKYKLEKGDVLVNRTNSIELVGRTGVFNLDGDYVFASYLIRIRPKKDIINPYYLSYYLNYAQPRLRQIATRAVQQANINARRLKEFKIPLPPLEEQNIIVEIIRYFIKMKKVEMQLRNTYENIKKALMSILFTGRVRVKDLSID